MYFHEKFISYLSLIFNIRSDVWEKISVTLFLPYPFAMCRLVKSESCENAKLFLFFPERTFTRLKFCFFFVSVKVIERKHSEGIEFYGIHEFS